jgi:hypothetical protein
MHLLTKTTLCVFSLVATGIIASAETINFDEFAATDNDAQLTTAYAGDGVTFSGNAGTWGGIAHGDPGSWSVNGTNGPNFLGDNGANNGATYTDFINFATAQSSVSFDASRTNGSSAGQTLKVEAFDASNALLDTETLTLGAINTWSTFDVNGADIATVELIGSANGFSPFGIDNLEFTAAAPEPGYAVILAVSLLGLFAYKQRTTESKARRSTL